MIIKKSKFKGNEVIFAYTERGLLPLNKAAMNLYMGTPAEKGFIDQLEVDIVEELNQKRDAARKQISDDRILETMSAIQTYKKKQKSFSRNF